MEGEQYLRRFSPEVPNIRSAVSLLLSFFMVLQIIPFHQMPASVIKCALWLTAAVVGAIDSFPVFPKLMELVGLAYSLWFSTRYLLFKENRDELTAKIEEIKQQVLGSDDD